MKKVLVLVALLLMVGGCSKDKFLPNYDKMQISTDGINGYTLDLRIYGNNSSKNINEILRIENYNNKEYKITIIDSKKERDENEEIIYVLDNKTYIANEEEKYNLTDKDIKYNDPSIYLNGLKNISKISKTKKEKIGEITYDVYDVVYNTRTVEEILRDTSLSGIKIKESVTGKIYINEDGYVYRVIYNIDNITINANYFGINKARGIDIPEELKEEKGVTEE